MPDAAGTGGRGARPKLCVVVSTPLTVAAFLKPHLIALSQHFDVTLATNPDNDAYVAPIDLPVRQVAIGISRRMAPLSDLRTLGDLLRLFRRERFDMVVSITPKAGLLGMMAARLSGVRRRLHIFQGEAWASGRGLFRALLKSADRVTARCATHLLAVGEGERRFLETERVTTPGRVKVLGAGSIAGVDLARFRRDPAKRSEVRAAQGIPDKAVLCLFVGRMNADKGLLELAEAFSQYARDDGRAWLMLVGPDEEGILPRLKERLAGVAARVVFEDFSATPERFFSATDILCLPSYREGFPVTILEAAAAEVPAVGSDVYGVNDAIVDGQTGILVPVRNAGELAAALARLTDDAPLRRRLAAAARERVEREFEQKLVVGHYVDYVRGLMVTGG